MPYTPDPNDPTQPTEDKFVESAAAEFRAVKNTLGNFLAYPSGELATYKGPLPAAASRAGRVLAFDAVDGKPAAGPLIGDISGAAASASAAAASAVAADAAADAAALSASDAAASAASVNAANLLTKAGNLAGLASAATARSNLGLVIGTDVLAPNGSGAALTGMLYLGVGQTLQDVTASRAPNTVYTNSTGKPIFVNTDVMNNTTGGASAIRVGATLYMYGSSAISTGNRTACWAVVPPGETYQLVAHYVGSLTTLNKWMELR